MNDDYRTYVITWDYDLDGDVHTHREVVSTRDIDSYVLRMHLLSGESNVQARPAGDP